MLRALVVVAALSAALAAPSQPPLNLRFAADVRSTATIGNQTMTRNMTVAADSKTFKLAQTQLAEPFDKEISQIFDLSKLTTCDNGAAKCGLTYMVEPFFKEKVCYENHAAVGPSTATPASAFAQAVDGLVAATAYATAKYKASTKMHGETVEEWVVSQTSPQMNRTSTYYVTAKGDLLKLSAVAELQGGHQFVQTVEFDNYVSPAPASAFAPPKGECEEITSSRAAPPSLLVAPALLQAVNDPTYIDELNSQDLPWTAGPNPAFTSETWLETTSRLGAMIATLELPLREPHDMDDAAIPTSFDAQKEWPKCKSISTIRNQGACGSCWAFAATESLEDRHCIAHGTTEVLAPEYLVGCDKHDGGCMGGFLDNAWQFLVADGLVTESCDPYLHCDYPPFANCTKGSAPPAPPAQDSCPSKCKDGSALKTLKAKSAYAVAKPGDVKGIQKEIMAHGPVEVAFFVFSDFMQYQGGVYTRSKTSQQLGGHAVKLVGWGVDGGVEYWKVANSWSPSWGEDGFFRIRRGTNECGIETTPAAGLA